MFNFVQMPHVLLPHSKAQSLRSVHCTLSSRSTQEFLSVSYAVSKSHLSRRTLISLAVTSLAAVPTSTSALSSPRRTVLDEERELNEKMLKQAEEYRIGALKAAFVAIEKASLQLGDLRQFADEQDWDGVRSFSRHFNDAVERNGMEPIAKKLRDKTDRKAALAVCKQVTEALKQVDRAAKLKDREGVIVHVQETRDIIAKFQMFRP